jgi:hypothetical protein
VARLASEQSTRTELLRDFRGFEAVHSSDPESLTDPDLIAEIEPFLSIHDATCYRVVSQQEAARAWANYQRTLVHELRLGRSFSLASAWDELLQAVERRTEESTDGSALVSLVMCQPDSLVFRELKRTQAYVDLRSGTAWDLHLIGYAAINTFGTMRPSVLGIPTWRFRAGRFLDVVAHVQHGHAAGLAASDSAVAGSAPWRYSGTGDLVSFMAYRDLPGLIDWPSLKGVQLHDAQGAYLDRSIGQIVEIMSDWREDGPEVQEFAPGEMRQTAISVLDLRRALIVVAGMVTSGVIGNAAYDLLKQLIGAH